MKKDEFFVTNVCICDGEVDVSTFIFTGLNSASDKFHDLKSEAKELFKESKDITGKDYVIDDNPCKFAIYDKESLFNDCIIITLKKIEK